ncbi:putative F-box/FBD/LRR-repeat protein-like [Capsicum annuum]|nr:F-box/FBD/LRR-repeat protein At1g13570 [Capsicum annuum]XP_016575783.1 F-box/FBD/LRR-repeat protein At1g13570 [Capsicum annuum]XP_016575784.1 F-box/FBD/LRR-repeat protein At1g13570 [Capsicum annuum]KAF3646702.1 putative F-box/FBD/LRR-repeat protein-like [Capsicum annuum]
MMDSKGKNHCSPDVLSNLPDNVIDDILMRVPFRDAVCTSILSKKWRYKWCGLPQLMLDSDFWKPKKDIEYLTGDKTVWRATKDLTGNFTACIHNLMTRHKGSITNFTLCIQYWKICPRIDNLLCFLSEKGIQHLVLRLPRSFELPSSFFTCLQLRHLSLQNCLLLPPPTFKGFDRLISLELHDVKVSSKLLECLISHCLLLEQLVLKISDTLSDIIEINAPMLRYFDFKGDMTTICLKYVPLLAKLSLWYYRKDRKKFDVANFLTSDFLESCFALEHLHLDYTVNARGQEIPTKLPFDLMCVKHLCMCIYLDKEEILSALCLIRSFPFLRYLEIQMEYNIMNDMLALECLEVEAFPDVISKHLREVKLVEANGSMREMQLIKLLLAKTPALVRMLIKPHRYLEKSAIVKRLAELTKFEIASPKAEVLLKLV